MGVDPRSGVGTAEAPRYVKPVLAELPARAEVMLHLCQLIRASSRLAD